MEPPRAVVPVGAVRERVIQTLTDAFANDLITVAELEDRLERAYRATTAEEALALIAGLQGSVAPTSATADARDLLLRRDRERMLSVFSSQSRRGTWTVPRELDIVAYFSDTTIDLTNAILPREIVDIRVAIRFANVTIVVPPGLRVVNRTGAFFGNVESDPALDLAPMTPGSPVIRVSGSCVFGNLEIVSGVRAPQ